MCSQPIAVVACTLVGDDLRACTAAARDVRDAKQVVGLTKPEVGFTKPKVGFTKLEVVDAKPED